MPSIKDQSTVEAIAREYCSNGRNEEQALLKIGYSKAYARSGLGNRVYSNILLKAAIAKIDGETRVKHVADRKERQEFWTDLMKTAPNMNDRLRASELLGKSQADFVDITLAIPDLPADITVEQADEFRAMAKAATNLRIA